MPRRHFTEELEDLKARLIEMSRLAAAAVKNSVKSLIDRDVKMANKVIEEDEKIDELEFEIEDTCIRLIALQQPMAEDLRTIGACLKIITDLERIGDRAVDICEMSKELAGKPLVKPLIDIPRMSEIAVKMIEDSSKAFETHDSSLAYAIGKRDDEVDMLCQQVMRELISFIIEDPKKTSDASKLMFVASYLERIADHATNIGERIIYMTEGKKVKIN